MKRIELKGITWNHSRGITPMHATAQRFSEMHAGIEIKWEKRSLQAFADFSVQELAERYDLLVIDHPWAGFAARTKSILPLDDYLSSHFLKDLEENSVGHSHKSYQFDGHQWALAIDAATPVASSRPDLLRKHGLTLPATYEELLEIADRGFVGFALIPIDTLMSFYMFCCSLGEDPCQTDEHVVSEVIGVRALQLFKRLADKVHKRFHHLNPIQVYEYMANTDDIAYCPFAYGYSNYARHGYAPRVLDFHDLVSLDGKENMRSTLGGTGLAVSAKCQYLQEAMDYVRYVASPACQLGLYFDNGGQPGHLKAWQSVHTNKMSGNYFYNTLPALQRAFLRPRYHGHMFFQDHAGDVVRNFIIDGGNEQAVLQKLNELYQESKALV
ncbi:MULTISPECIES: ABC transporter substrate-binding protein [Olivibacter]|jgi:multiple sugar transport system substrate-binding protein|uniref:ABC transporter substrate-binding protein n=1 Tax=Olivibacter oleidegradans TaxID=760123 RepID=A0ABV6HS81_9SPHI|nr:MULTISPECIES: extracellular solute-binding protein [Olivibacter]MDM8176119.1 extracellular solute-binding protein [Olivibacter sp. 47]QEL00884.1 extracellular solute-binding protein [Olivibacter sp. LS-1]